MHLAEKVTIAHW